MPTSDAAQQADAAFPTAPAEAPTSAERLITTLGNINNVDVANAPEADRAAVIELIDIINDEQRSSLLFALLLERLRTDV
ncbi:hypothetical protein [Cryobacterium sp. SO1]|uniref:hypothetical protein n=1 Tax=Cryobacterium sp. SO1 TaxID=1897061 RepID=UPI001023008E|nr:hypothetical protein [Cryobacterium sp. SO1]RZI36996.1 hypothetical protein BJQ95_00597 [Cryobacterium sp. SO1]